MVPGLGPGLGDGGGKGQRRHMVSALGSCYLSPKGQGLRMSPGVVATGGGGRREPAYIRGGLGPATPLQAPPRPPPPPPPPAPPRAAAATRAAAAAAAAVAAAIFPEREAVTLSGRRGPSRRSSLRSGAAAEGA